MDEWPWQGLSGPPRLPRPVAPAPGLALNTEDRILLYLSDFRNMEDRYVLPQALSQKAIAYAAGIQRKHLSRYLDQMTKEGYLTEAKTHIEGEKQRMLAYYLAPRGWERALEIKRDLAILRVPVRMRDGHVEHMKLEEIDKSTSIHLTFADIVREAMKVDTLEIGHLEGIDERRKRDMDERVKDLEDYARALMTAWKDGRVSATERLLIEQLRERLGVSKEEHDRLESQVIEEVLSNREGIYRAVAVEAFEHGPATPEQRELLEALRKKLGLSEEEARDVEAKLSKHTAA